VIASKTISLTDEDQALSLFNYPGVQLNAADPNLILNKETNVDDWVSSAIMIDTARGVIRRIVGGWSYHFVPYDIICWYPEGSSNRHMANSALGQIFYHTLELYHVIVGSDGANDYGSEPGLYCRIDTYNECDAFEPCSLMDVWQYLDGLETIKKGLMRFMDGLTM